MTKIFLIALALGTPAVALAAPATVSQAAIDQEFALMDANRDGRIDKTEYAKFRQARLDTQAQKIDAALVELDKDKDGKISKAEAAAVPQLAQYFDALDADKDGFLSQAEMQRALAAAQAQEANLK